ncbi:MAG: 50S ribosomal protein L35 [Candidatus Margulisbacteria bacterium]|nr:50S ribosomal protein L35 [Candidatus Margulisiibacteriota bacterium]MBU1021731.1 50S ribosomal protein L35 [Candidatus Margulisiibacteriota bacterium]MBU1729477.1 50S ribosomal protein L35 [Candidatus Margulisiibacteriota bacterium]MBU1955422.1 50S ribosomal protein L35 [Candidatus Margulisiibacteriota bacterium]
MPKLKTRKAAAKRFKKTGTGKIKRGNTNRRHILESKSKKNKRQGRRDVVISPSDVKRVKKMLPGF